MLLKILGYSVVISLIFCVYLIVRKHQALKNSEQFAGTVVGHARSGSKGSTYALTVEYRDGNSVNHVFTAPGSSNPPARPIGAKVVVFEHRDGSTPDVLVFESVYLGLWIWLCVGLSVLGCFLAPLVLNFLYRP